MSENKGRYSRQEGLVPLDRLATIPVDINGVGAVGRQIALQLAAMGVPKIRIIDFDTVEVENLSSQGWMEEDLGKKKVHAVVDQIKRINSEVEVEAIDGRFRKTQIIPGAIVFASVDNMDVRKAIFEAYRGKCTLFIDGRMAGEVLRVLTAYDELSAENYEKTLFPQTEAFEGRCTQKSTIYASNVIAGIEISMMTKLLRGMSPEGDVSFNLLTMELDVE